MYMYEHRMEKFRDFEEKVAENNATQRQKIVLEVSEDFRGLKGTVKINHGELTIRSMDFGWELEIWREYNNCIETGAIKISEETPGGAVAWIHDYLVDQDPNVWIFSPEKYRGA